MAQNVVLDNKSLNEIDMSSVITKLNNISSKIDNIKIKDNYTLIELTTDDWSATTFNSESCFKATKTLTGATADSHPEIWFLIGTINTADDEFIGFNLIYRAICGTNNITFYAYEKPTIKINVQVKGW